MDYLLDIFLVLFSTVIGFIFGIFNIKLNTNRKLLDNQLTFVYTPLYREICFTNLGTKPDKVLEIIRDVIYTNFQYVPDDLYDISIKLLKKSKSADFDLWSSIEWSDFVDYVEKQYLWIQQSINLDKKAQNPDIKRYRNKQILNCIIFLFICFFMISFNLFLGVKYLHILFNNPENPNFVLFMIGLNIISFILIIDLIYNVAQNYTQYISQ